MEEAILISQAEEDERVAAQDRVAVGGGAPSVLDPDSSLPHPQRDSPPTPSIDIPAGQKDVYHAKWCQQCH
eukprot:5393836-Heterocapsa_arctica.AAC.1